MKVLIAEDDENSRLLQHTILESAGHTVLSAANGREAFQVLARSIPDLIISDIMMPEMDGYAFCRAVKSDPAFAHIPFVFYSATFTTEADKQLAAELGSSLFLIKPMEPDEFMATIQKVLDQGISASPPVSIPSLDAGAIDVKYASSLARKLDKKVVELKRAHTELATTQAQLERIKESYQFAQKIARIGIWDWDLVSGEFWWSDELYHLLGVPPETPPTRDLLLRRIAPDDRPRFERAMRMAEEKAIPFHMDNYVLGAGDVELMIRAEVSIAHFDHTLKKPRRLVCVMQDITQQRKMESEKARLELNLRQSQKIEALGTMAGSIAHDFKNILMIVQANAESLRMEGASRPADEIEQLNQIIAACRRAGELAGQIMTFSRQEKMAKVPTPILPVMEEVLRLIRSILPPGISMNSRLDAACPAVVANSTQIHQVIMNLCMNAIQAMTGASGTIEVTMEPVIVQGWDPIVLEGLKAGKYVLIQVQDRGCGMDNATRERIFEPYFTTKEAGGGTGLGLSVAYGIVLEHNGQISVSSEEGSGSTFSVYLPVA